MTSMTAPDVTTAVERVRADMARSAPFRGASSRKVRRAVDEEALEVVLSAAAELDRLSAALWEIVGMEPCPFAMPADHSAQIAACPECQRYEGHPIQRGICDAHRRPFWDREKHDAHAERALGYRMKSVARTALQQREK